MAASIERRPGWPGSRGSARAPGSAPRWRGGMRRLPQRGLVGPGGGAGRSRPGGRGSLVFTGATASLRGGAKFAAFAGALLFASFQVVTSRLASVDDMVTTNLCSGNGVLVVLRAALALLPTEVLPTLRGASRSQWLLIGGLAAFATLGQMAMTVAIRAAPLSMLCRSPSRR